MNEILIAVIIVAAMGLIIGLILAVASVIMAVPKDERAEAVLEVLPGANCGACGYSGCSGYAKALAHGEAQPGLCSPGGEECVKEIARVLGVEAGAVERKTAVVRCDGTKENTNLKMEYQGINTCAAASGIHGGTKDCYYGCIGFGDCVNVCEYGAITIENSVARISPDKCKSCGLCVKACPKKLITIVPVKKQAVVMCSNCDKGAAAGKVCKTSCIACMKCAKACPSKAIKLENFHASVNPKLCTGCGECQKVCPKNCIGMMEG